MSNLAIKVENLSKLYKIGALKQRHNTLRDHLAHGVKSFFSRNGHSSAVGGRSSSGDGRSDTIWALKDVSFDIKPGETVGFIGRNGAGKSTLLKILSRITEPTKGYAEIKGRVGSLLEVGTGFHPELSGRENIYLNGAVLGMRKAEITRKFDEIVDFSGVEKFLDTPVKRYSSGMNVRLAFAVAAHLETEILIVDEVLAVGDAEFQKKCLKKMEDVGHDGRTVLFVSHNILAVNRLCERAILLRDGSVFKDGLPHHVASTYSNSVANVTGVREWLDPTKAPRGDVTRLRAVRVRTDDGRITDSVDIRQPIGIEMEFEVLKPGYVLMPALHFYNEEGIRVFPSHDVDPAWRKRPRPKGCYRSTVWIPGNFLSEGVLSVTASIDALNPLNHQFYEDNILSFHVLDSCDGESARGDWGGALEGAVRPLLKWSTQFSPSEPEIKAPDQAIDN